MSYQAALTQARPRPYASSTVAAVESSRSWKEQSRKSQQRWDALQQEMGWTLADRRSRTDEGYVAHQEFARFLGRMVCTAYARGCIDESQHIDAMRLVRLVATGGVLLLDEYCSLIL